MHTDTPKPLQYSVEALEQRFWDLTMNAQISVGAVKLYRAIIRFGRQAGWQPRLYLPNSRLTEATGLSVRQINNLRRSLEQFGLLKFCRGCMNRCAACYILPAMEEGKWVFPVSVECRVAATCPLALCAKNMESAEDEEVISEEDNQTILTEDQEVIIEEEEEVIPEAAAPAADPVKAFEQEIVRTAATFTPMGAADAKGSKRPRYAVDDELRNVANNIWRSMEGGLSRDGQAMKWSDELKLVVLKSAAWLNGEIDSRGLLLHGDCGNGKTTLGRSLCNTMENYSSRELGYGNRKQPFIRSAKEIVRMCHESAESANGKRLYDRLSTEEVVMIDDMGSEEECIKIYGTEHHPIADIITERYSRGLPTIVTSNLTLDELGAKYGHRVHDRLREMIYAIHVPIPSYRGLIGAAALSAETRASLERLIGKRLP